MGKSFADKLIGLHLDQLERLVEQRGVRGLKTIYEGARRDLAERLRAAGGPTSEKATAIQLRAMIAQIDSAMEALGRRVAGHLGSMSTDIATMGARQTIDEYLKLEQHYRGTTPVLDIERAGVFRGMVDGVEKSLLRRHSIVAQTWSASQVGDMERSLSVGVLSGKPLEDMIDQIVGEQGLLERERYRAERIVRTEGMYTHGVAKHEAMRRTNESGIPIRWKRLIETFDDRTGDDSFVLHGQTVPVDQPFVWQKKRKGGWERVEYMHPPNRPNDRAVVIPWDIEWKDTKEDAPLTEAELHAARPTRWRRKVGVPVPPGHVPGGDVFAAAKESFAEERQREADRIAEERRRAEEAEAQRREAQAESERAAAERARRGPTQEEITRREQAIHERYTRERPNAPTNVEFTIEHGGRRYDVSSYQGGTPQLFPIDAEGLAEPGVWADPLAKPGSLDAKVIAEVERLRSELERRATAARLPPVVTPREQEAAIERRAAAKAAAAKKKVATAEKKAKLEAKIPTLTRDEEKAIRKQGLVGSEQVHIDIGPKTMKLAQAFFGRVNKKRPVTPDQVAALTGARDAKIESGYDDFDDSEIIRVNSIFKVKTTSGKLEDGFNDRTIRVEEGELILHNDYFRLPDNAPKGLGLEIFSRQVRAAANADIKKIETTAARSESMNGYYTWARFGYDGDLPPTLRAKTGYKKISELMATEAGRALWKAEGKTTDMEFDLTPGSYSMQTLERYIRETGNKAALEAFLGKVGKK